MAFNKVRSSRVSSKANTKEEGHAKKKTSLVQSLGNLNLNDDDSGTTTLGKLSKFHHKRACICPYIFLGGIAYGN